MQDWWNSLSTEHKVAVGGIAFLIFITLVTAPL